MSEFTYPSWDQEYLEAMAWRLAARAERQYVRRPVWWIRWRILEKNAVMREWNSARAEGRQS